MHENLSTVLSFLNLDPQLEKPEYVSKFPFLNKNIMKIAYCSGVNRSLPEEEKILKTDSREFKIKINEPNNQRLALKL